MGLMGYFIFFLFIELFSVRLRLITAMTHITHILFGISSNFAIHGTKSSIDPILGDAEQILLLKL
jgi:hypothetical protein